MKKNNKGFTLAELLIVVAIIAVLVAIAIPVFTAQLEKAREATDLANVRSAYAEMMVEYLQWDGKSATTISDIVVPAKQTQANWQCDASASTTMIAEGHSGAGIPVPANANGNYTLTIDTDDGTISVS